jgi:hypothetical protein
MIHTDVFQRFVEDSPVCVMVQALMENTLSPTLHVLVHRGRSPVKRAGSGIDPGFVERDSHQPGIVLAKNEYSSCRDN